MWRIKYLVIFLGALLLLQCTEKLTERNLHVSEILEWTPEVSDLPETSCFDNLSYVPDTTNAFVDNIRYIRMNIHFMNSTDWKSNYYGEIGRKYARDMLYYANRKLVFNRQMSLPVGNETAVYDPLYQYVLEPEGIYFHADNDLYFYVNEGKRNNYKRAVIDKYKINEDTVLNVFYMVHHPDSVRSKTYSASAAGIALGKSLKMGTKYDPDDKPWAHAALLNHEVGHVLGLSHTWNTNDGCDDTPKNRNCWHSTESGRCKGVVSNNLMDYNSNQNATSPCQIGKMRKNMSKLKSRQRDLVKKTWCRLDPSKDVIIDREVHFAGAKDLEGNLRIRNGGILHVSCRLSMPGGSKILVEPGGLLILDDAHLHNDCGLEWNGIVILRKGKEEGKVYKKGEFKIENVKGLLAEV